MTKSILFEKRDSKAYITFNRPEAMNSISPDGFQLLVDYFKDAQNDEEIRVIILTGSGDKAFCAGADLKKTIPLISEGKMDIEQLNDAVLKNVPVWKPIIAAVNGYCLAGGTEILQATDIRIASEDAIFGLPETKWSIMAAAGSLVRLVRQIPYCKAMEILLTGEQITAQQAEQIGLINKVVPKESLMNEVERYAEIICENGPLSVQNTKRAVIELLNMPIEEAYRKETSYAKDVFTSSDAKEGFTAFAEKRKPHFKGY